jgi:hypothetical protein
LFAPEKKNVSTPEFPIWTYSPTTLILSLSSAFVKIKLI